MDEKAEVGNDVILPQNITNKMNMEKEINDILRKIKEKRKKHIH